MIAEGRRLMREDSMDFMASRIPTRIRIRDFVDSGTLESVNSHWNLAGQNGGEVGRGVGVT